MLTQDDFTILIDDIHKQITRHRVENPGRDGSAVIIRQNLIKKLTEMRDSELSQAASSKINAAIAYLHRIAPNHGTVGYTHWHHALVTMANFRRWLLNQESSGGKK